jgi:hypothetical protein
MAQDPERPVRPGNSLPANPATRLRTRPRSEDTAALATPRATWAAYQEGRVALLFAAGTCALVLALLLLTLVNPGEEDIALAPGTVDPWTGSLLTLVLLLVALQLVSVLLALEHRVGRPAPQGERTPLPGVPVGMAVIWGMRSLVTLAVVLAVYVAWGGEFWAVTWAVPPVAELVALGLLVWAWRTQRQPPPIEPVAPSGFADDAPAPDEGTPEQPSTRLFAIGASGGGIRAAAFVLGGHQAVQESSAELDCATAANEPHVFAVSGGSYIGAALALRRRFDLTGRLRADDDPGAAWRTAYTMDSPEVERLRRHTRYLFEPTWRTRDGIVSLVMGAVVNLFIVAVALRMVTWLSTQIAVTLGFVQVETNDRGKVIDLDLTPGWGPRDWVAVLAVPVVCLALIALLTVLGWHATSEFDNTSSATEHGKNPTERRVHAMGWLDRSARIRPGLLLAAVAWLVLAVGIPGATVGVAHLTTSNLPTATVASLLRSGGFVTQEMCTESFVDRVQVAVRQANNAARISPGEKREVTTGACGLETTVARTVDTRGDTNPRNDRVIQADRGAARALAQDHGLPGQVVGVGVLLALVLGLLRRGPSPEATVATGFLRRLQRGLLTWLPLVIVGGLAVYFTLLWTFGFLAKMDADYRATAAVITVLGCTMAFLIDPNATSMHGFYRSRLSDAFAVGVDDDTGRAAELPPAQVYRFSDLRQASPPQPDTGEPAPLRSRPRLHIVTTLNSQAANEAPTMRGGFPLVLGPDEVNVYREERRRVHVGMRDYENFAGPGRVSIMASVATSGAAISPLMGRYAVQMAPYRALLALFNLRVGAWVRNPMHTGNALPALHQAPQFLWMTRKPGLAQVALEAAGSTSADGRWIYLSDGGHLDNTGLVESVRHCVLRQRYGRVLVLDASNDPVDTWSAVGDAIGVVRADLDVDLRRVHGTGYPPWMRRYQGAGLDVLVVKAVRTAVPADLEADTTDPWWDLLPPNVQSFQLVHADFPRSSTARQKFGDLEFEAYRGLGFAATIAALDAAGWTTT